MALHKLCYARSLVVTEGKYVAVIISVLFSLWNDVGVFFQVSSTVVVIDYR